MAFFSSSPAKKTEEPKAQAIPPEILSSVRVMADEMKPSVPAPSRPEAPANLPLASSASSPSPFLNGPARTPLPTSSSASRDVSPSPARNPGPPFVSTPAPVKMARARAVTPSPADSEKSAKNPAGKKWLLFLTLGVIVLLILAGGGYYYWQNSQDKGEVNAPGGPPLPGGMPVPGDPQLGTPPSVPSIKTLPYALDKPNYLSIDTETTEVTGVKKDIDEVVARLVEGNVAEPIEFNITDKNNNPIAFSRFAYLLGLSLPEGLVAEIDEDFSLYLSAENGRGVVGLKLLLKDAAKGSALITQGEGSLPKQFAVLLYSGTNIIIPATVTFTPSPERADVRIVRYHNFSLSPNISFDYTLSDKQWFIGTSKETFRLMLEKAE